jgi:hypothetical protein
VSALGGVSPPKQPTARDGLLLSTLQSESIRQALTDIARNAAAGQAHCDGRCTSSTGTQNVLCSVISTPISCPSGGTTSLAGNVDFALNCATKAFVANIAFDLAFSHCSSNGVTLNAPSPVKLAGRIESQTSSVSLTIKANGLQVRGSYCSRNIDQTCDIDLSIAGTERNPTVGGQICGCDASKLAAATNACSASC